MIDPSSPTETPAAETTPKARDTALRHAIEAFYFGYRAFTALPDRVLEQRGLGRVHHRILYFVARNPRLAVNELLTLLAVTKQALNGPLRRLVEMRLVEMHTAEHDRRVRQLVLTPGGAKLEAKLTGSQLKLLRAAFDEAGPAAEAGWHKVMGTLAARAGKKGSDD